MALSFDADGERFRRAATERLSPYRALATAAVEPLPHQIGAVYRRLLARRPVRFLLADDPGTGKTIVAGLLLRELMAREGIERCLIVAPGAVAEQWQEELREKFALDFALLAPDATGPPREPRLIARFDLLVRSNALRARVARAGWDLAILDEAHKVATGFSGDAVRRTRRYDVGAKLAAHSRHLLLATATPHNGREEDFELLLGLLDPDRFEGRHRPGAAPQDPSDLVRRLGKQELRRFDGTPLFPPRHCHTVPFELTPAERDLHLAVSAYVAAELAHAALLGPTERQRRAGVELALQVLQRRLSSSPEAIARALAYRRVQLEERHRQASLNTNSFQRARYAGAPRSLGAEELEEFDDRPQDEIDDDERYLLDEATSARTIGELGLELRRLKELETEARRLRQSGVDSKWAAFARLLDEPGIAGEKLIVFTESRDTLADLAARIALRLGDPAQVASFHGGQPPEERRAALRAFLTDERVRILCATDAAGEGINLQVAHVVINYDLPWNPSRLEQRFGRIHRIGQTAPCHLWSLVPATTGEGELYRRLLDKVDQMSRLVGDPAWDVFGQLFDVTPLPHLLLEAAGARDPATRSRLHRAVEDAASRAHIEALLARRALPPTDLDPDPLPSLPDRLARPARSEPLSAEEGALLRRGAILIDDRDPTDRPRLLLFVEQAIRDAAGARVSERLVALEATPAGDLRQSPAPVDFPSLRPPDERERAALAPLLEPWLGDTFDGDLPARAAPALAPFRDQLARRRAPLLDRIEAEVAARLAELPDRLAARRERLRAERLLDDEPPRLVAACLLVPAGALATSAAPRGASGAPPYTRP